METIKIKSLGELGAKSSTVRAVVVKIDETDCWSEEIQTKAKGKIYGIYCASIAVDYPAYWIKNHFENIEIENGDWIDDELTLLEFQEDGGSDFSYFNEHSRFDVIDEISQTDEQYKKEQETINDDPKKAHEQWIESLIENYRANSSI
jgi:hypothetical protein